MVVVVLPMIVFAGWLRPSFQNAANITRAASSIGVGCGCKILRTASMWAAVGVHFQGECHNCLKQIHIKASVPDGNDKPLPVSSSTRPNFPWEQEKLFHEVLQVMNSAGVPYAVSGAFALQQHTGIWRDTKDLDLFLPAEHVPQALAALVADGFECEICDPVWLAKAHRADFYVDLICGMSNAVITVDQSWMDRATPFAM